MSRACLPHLASRGVLPLVGFVYLGAAAGLVHLSRTRQYWVVYALSVFICYFTAIVLGPTAYSRVRMPFMPFLSLLAAIGLLSWLHRRRPASPPI